MSTLPSNSAPLKRLPSALPIDLGKPVASVTRLRMVQNHQPAPRTPSLFSLPKEPEDARLTGGTRSLDRRLLALNLSRARVGADAA